MSLSWVGGPRWRTTDPETGWCYALWVVLALAAVACSPAGAERGVEPVVVPPGAEAAVQAARDDLGARTGSANLAELRTVEPMEWPDSSLGCPQPDMMYAQVITPGYRIVLAVEGNEYVYHTDARRAVYCPQDSPNV